MAELAEKVKLLTEQLLATGIFILPRYRNAEQAMSAALADPTFANLYTNHDPALQRILLALPYLELIYLTYIEGIQISNNVFRTDSGATLDITAKGFRQVR